MKKNIKNLIFYVLLVPFFPSMMQGYFWNSSIDPVEMIKRKSDLTKKDIDRWITLVRFGRIIGAKGAAVLGPLSAVAGSAAAYNFSPDKFTEFFETIGKYIPSMTLSQSIAAMSVGTLAALYASYKYWYPRTREALLNKVRAFDAMCNGFGLRGNPLNIDTVVGNVSFGVYDKCRAALENLAQQATIASELLQQLGEEQNSPLAQLIQIYTTNITAVLASNTLNNIIETKKKEAETKALQEKASKSFMERVTGWYQTGKQVAGDFASATEKIVTQGPRWVGYGTIGYFAIKGAQAYWQTASVGEK